ncbi:ABC transporter substrate-binding protein [Flavihumibacter rivuli]|uniref:ABC transporter substrate-binding protein n=1 Tax=Flavihumibacter rivuli TaxID=2838156 RepID=UPI001BDE5356|nr:ABC transporter substrate-binding protein [Flavihumibacter rivuli]ULQ57922.1 ABC transporter substrate-binding protein [Flavihumibacter rivuli]
MTAKLMYRRVVAVLIFLVSCGKREQGNNIFCYNESSGIATLDPAFAKNQSIMWAVHQLYSTLVEVDSNLNIVPLLAKDWEVAADGRTYTFHLRTDVYFHDSDVFPGGKGRRLTASDVAFSLKRIMDPATASSGAWIFNGKVDPDEGFTALDDSTFQLRLLQPFRPILGILSMQYCSVVAKEAVTKYGKDFGRHPVGSGPFRFVAWEEGQVLLLKKHAAYFERDAQGKALPYVDGVKISFYDSKATEFLLFRQGKLHFINDIDPSFKDEVLSKRGNLRKEWEGKVRLSRHPYLNTEYLGILVDSNNALVRTSPLKSKLIRQAINYGFDRRKMMLYLRNSIGIAAESGFVPAGLPSFDSAKVKGFHYDPDRSRRLLAAAGFPGGKGLPEVRLLTIPIYADLSSFIARELKEIGITVQVEVVQKSLLLEQTAQSKALFFRASWIADYPDAENYLGVFYSRNPAPPNYTRYNNPEYDRLYETALLEQDDTARFEIYRKMDQLLIEDAPVVPLWYDEVVRLVQPGVEGLTPNGLNLLEIRRLRFVEGKGR